MQVPEITFTTIYESEPAVEVLKETIDAMARRLEPKP
jgi:hypothetical protein